MSVFFDQVRHREAEIVERGTFAAPAGREPH